MPVLTVFSTESVSPVVSIVSIAPVRTIMRIRVVVLNETDQAVPYLSAIVPNGSIGQVFRLMRDAEQGDPVATLLALGRIGAIVDDGFNCPVEMSSDGSTCRIEFDNSAFNYTWAGRMRCSWRYEPRVYADGGGCWHCLGYID